MTTRSGNLLTLAVCASLAWALQPLMAQPQQPNEECEGAETLAVPAGGSVDIAGETITALPDLAPFCGTSDSSNGVWYMVTGTGNTMTASTCNQADYDTKIRVYCSECDDLNCVTGLDDSPGCSGFTTEVSWCSQSGASYLILVHGFGSEVGNFTLTVSDDGSACTGAIECLPVGACCQCGVGDQGCSLETAGNCQMMDGVYLGDGTDCEVPGSTVVVETAPNVEIPDNDPTGLGDTINMGMSFPIADLDVDLSIEHTWIGDVCVVLEHNGTSVQLVDRMGADTGLGVPCHQGTPFGCSDNNMDIILDDEGPDGPIEDACAMDLTGFFVPNELLSAFDGMDAAGPWNLSVSDNGGGDTGTLLAWSLHFRQPSDELPPCASVSGNPSSSQRAETATKGSLLVYPNIEVKWEPNGASGFALSQDTVLSIVNEYNTDVDVRFMFVNGDDDLAAELVGNPPVVVERAHHGWTRFNWTTRLTANESTWFSMAGNSPSGPPAFSSLDNGPGGPGRPDPESTNGGRYMRGYALVWAVDSLQREINWNFLSGKGTVVHYGDLEAWEYPATAYAALGQSTGSQALDCVGGAIDGTCCNFAPIPGQLDLDGFQYAGNFNTLLLDFYAAGSSPLSNNGLTGMIDTDLTLLPMIQDLRQDNDGPVHTKADFDIWDENEELYSGTERCIWCWDQFLLSDTSLLSNNFLASELETDKGKARIDGVASSACDEAFCCERGDDQCISDYAQDNPGFEAPRCSEAAPLLGVAAKIIAFSGTTEGKSYAGSTLHGQGYDKTGQILADLPSTPEQLNESTGKPRNGKLNAGR